MNQRGTESRLGQKRFLPSYRIKLIRSKGAILVIIWTALAWPCGSFNVAGLNPAKQYSLESLFWNTLYCFGLLYPVAGWIADSWTGRYRFLITCLYISFAAIISGCGSVLTYCYQYSYITGRFVLLIAEVLEYTGFAFSLIGHSGFAANAIPYLIDQMVGETAEQLSAAIHWYCWGIQLGNFLQIILYTVRFSDGALMTVVLPLIKALCLTIALLSNYSCHSHLDKKPLLQHPIRQICRVINYASRHKFPERRSAFTFWEEDYPSRIDLGKSKYGGPFVVEYVEDVKTFLRLLPLILITAGVGLQTEPSTLTGHLHPLESTSLLSDLFYRQHVFESAMAIVLIPIFRFVLFPLFYKYVPTLLFRMGCGILFSLISVMSYTLIESVGHMKSEGVPCYYQSILHIPNVNLSSVLAIDYQWTLLPELFHQLAFLLVTLSALEFIVAQSPNQMRGLMVGVWYAFFSVWQIIGYNMIIPYDILLPYNCLSYYFATKSIIIGTLLVVFMLYSRRYKLRMRDEVMNYNWIAEQHFDSCLRQERHRCNNRLTHY